MGLTKVSRLAEKLVRKGENESLVSQAVDAWKVWTDIHELHQTEMSPEGWKWIREAFVDGYLRGVQKKITGE